MQTPNTAIQPQGFGPWVFRSFDIQESGIFLGPEPRGTPTRTPVGRSPPDPVVHAKGSDPRKNKHILYVKTTQPNSSLLASTSINPHVKRNGQLRQTRRIRTQDPRDQRKPNPTSPYAQPNQKGKPWNRQQTINGHGHADTSTSTSTLHNP